MKPVKFRWTEQDEETGVEGWVPLHIPQGTAGQGITFAHDVLEHGLSDTHGQFEGECQAFGAMVVIRLACGDVTVNDIGYDMASFWATRLAIAPCPYRVRLPREIGHDIAEIVRSSRKWCRVEGYAQKIDQQAAVAIEGWIRHGARRALSRIRRARVDIHTINYLFMKLKDWSNKNQGHWEGEEITVRVDLRQRDFRITRQFD